MKQEAELLIQLTSQSAEELTADGQLEFDHMEKLISELQSVLSNELQRCAERMQQTHTEIQTHCIQHTCQTVTLHELKMCLCV